MLMLSDRQSIAAVGTTVAGSKKIIGLVTYHHCPASRLSPMRNSEKQQLKNNSHQSEKIPFKIKKISDETAQGFSLANFLSQREEYRSYQRGLASTHHICPMPGEQSSCNNYRNWNRHTSGGESQLVGSERCQVRVTGQPE